MKKIEETIENNSECEIEIEPFGVPSVKLTLKDFSQIMTIKDFAEIYKLSLQWKNNVNGFIYKLYDEYYEEEKEAHIVTNEQLVQFTFLYCSGAEKTFELTWETFHIYSQVVLNQLSISILPTVKSSEYQPALELDLLDEYDLPVSILQQSGFRGAPYIAFDRGSRWNYIGQRNFVRAYKRFVDKNIQSYEVLKKHLSLKFVQSSDPKKLVLEFYGMNRENGRYYYIFRHLILKTHLESYIETYVIPSTKEK